MTRSKIRALVRAAFVVVTAFGLDFDVEQVAALQLLAEALLQLTYKDEG
jgi:hypothetical protein